MSHEVSGATPDGSVMQPPVSKTKKEVLQLWRSHHLILTLQTTRMGPSAEPDDARQKEVSAVKLAPPVTMHLVTGGANIGSPKEEPSCGKVPNWKHDARWSSGTMFPRLWFQSINHYRELL